MRDMLLKLTLKVGWCREALKSKSKEMEENNGFPAAGPLEKVEG